MGYTKANRSNDYNPLIHCRDCGEVMSKNAWTCPKCGAPNFDHRRKALMPFAAIIVLAVVLYGVYKGVDLYFKHKDLAERERLSELWEKECEGTGAIPPAPPGL